MVLIVGVILLIAANVVVLSVNSRRQYTSYGLGKFAISLVAPFQEIVTSSMRSIRDVWHHYFALVSIAYENDRLHSDLRKAVEQNNRLQEMELANARLRKLLEFRAKMRTQVLAAEVIGQDPSPWFKTVIINKGGIDGVLKGLPVVIPEGITGLITEVSPSYSKVLLIIDQNSAVDALGQSTRARGIISGDPEGKCAFNYVLRKHDIQIGEIVVSSGLDGVFPKGLRIGAVSEVLKPRAGIFQKVIVTPFVDFEKLEEVLVILDRPTRQVEETAGS